MGVDDREIRWSQSSSLKDFPFSEESTQVDRHSPPRLTELWWSDKNQEVPARRRVWAQRRQNQILLEDGSTEGVTFNLDLDKWIMPRKNVPGRGNSLCKGLPALSSQQASQVHIHQQMNHDHSFCTACRSPGPRHTSQQSHIWQLAEPLPGPVSRFELLLPLQNFLTLGKILTPKESLITLTSIGMHPQAFVQKGGIWCPVCIKQ